MKNYIAEITIKNEQVSTWGLRATDAKEALRYAQSNARHAHEFKGKRTKTTVRLSK